MSRTCLFLINGLGMGNSTRCHAVIECLAEAGCRVHVVTSKCGLAYFKDKDCVRSLTPMESFYYSTRGGQISGWSTWMSLAAMLRIARLKRAQLDRVLSRINPDVVVTDSEYALSPARRRGIPIIGLNTSEMVVSEFLRSNGTTRGVRGHFWFIEFSDYLFHRHYCDLVLSPFPLRTPSRHRRFRRIGLIVRRELRQQAGPLTTRPWPTPRQLRKVVFMLSGSVHASQISLEGCQLPFRVEVVGRTGESRGAISYHGRTMDNIHLLLGADALVINGGYSAVSEAFLLRKPVFVVPVPGHAEQFVNSCLVRDLGVGFVASESDVVAQLLRAHATDKWPELRPMAANFEFDGAREAAEGILDFPIRQGSPSPVAPVPSPISA